MGKISDYTNTDFTDLGLKQGEDLTKKTVENYTIFGENLASYGVLACKVSLHKNMDKKLKNITETALVEGKEYGENIARIVKYERKMLLNTMVIKFMLMNMLGVVLAFSLSMFTTEVALIVIVLSTLGAWAFKGK